MSWLLFLIGCFGSVARWGNLGSAKADAQRAMDIDPHHIKAYFRRAAAHKQVLLNLCWTAVICIIVSQSCLRSRQGQELVGRMKRNNVAETDIALLCSTLICPVFAPMSSAESTRGKHMGQSLYGTLLVSLVSDAPVHSGEFAETESRGTRTCS